MSGRPLAVVGWRRLVEIGAQLKARHARLALDGWDALGGRPFPLGYGLRTHADPTCQRSDAAGDPDRSIETRGTHGEL